MSRLDVWKAITKIDELKQECEMGGGPEWLKEMVDYEKEKGFTHDDEFLLALALNIICNEEAWKKHMDRAYEIVGMM